MTRTLRCSIALAFSAIGAPLFMGVLLITPLHASPDEPTLPEGYLDEAGVAAVLDRTLTVRFDPDLSALHEEERRALDHLLRAGEVLHKIYMDQVHREAITAEAELVRLHQASGESARTGSLLDLYRIFKGPIATTLDNQRIPFVPASKRPPGKNVYPWGIEAAEISTDVMKAAEAETGDLFDPWSVVRRVGDGHLADDLRTYLDDGALRALHPKLDARLRRAVEAGKGWIYAVPYALAYHRELAVVRGELLAAADALENVDQDFAQYLRLRATDLLSNDYEAGDAAWVTGSFQNLNAQIGAYETYDDALFGVKAFFSMSLLIRDAEKTAELRAGLGSLQGVEDALPYARHKKVRDDIPVSVYNVIADYGQARGTNTATILPNDPNHARKYGRTILLRSNVMVHPEIFATSQDTFFAVIDESQHTDLGIEGNFHRTLWHEVGHYLGPSTDQAGRDHGETLQELSDLIEELKSDLVSLFALHRFHRDGLIDDRGLRSVQAGGILRVLQKVKPLREQPYQTMQLMQWNYFLQEGLLTFDPDSGRMTIHYDRYEAAVTAMLTEVLDLQDQGDKARAAAFVDKYATWSEDLHGVSAKAARDNERYRYRLVRYGVYGE